jgi:hypothetical protein
MKAKWRRIVLLSVLMPFTSLTTRAYDVRLNITGVLTSVGYYYNGPSPEPAPPANPFSVGDIAQWNLAYNLDLLPGAGNTSTDATYANAYYPGKDIFLEANLDGWEINGYPLILYVNNDSINSISVDCFSADDSHVGLTLNDSTGTALGGSDALPTSLSIADWDSSSFVLATPELGQTWVWYAMGTFPVPEASTLVLAGLGGFVVMLIVRRRR